MGTSNFHSECGKYYCIIMLSHYEGDVVYATNIDEERVKEYAEAFLESEGDDGDCYSGDFLCFVADMIDTRKGEYFDRIDEEDHDDPIDYLWIREHAKRVEGF